MYKISIAVIVVVGFVSTAIFLRNDETAPDILASNANTSAPLAEVKLPDALSQNAEIGKRAFDAKCASCHGINAAGQVGVAPPLVHIIYEPGHHGDESFQRAASDGVRAHHWPFGNMPPVEGVTRGDVTLIVAYIRELQQENGIN